MNREDFIEEFDILQQAEKHIILDKNHDYAQDTDAFVNLRPSGEQGILCRMQDKMARISNLLKADGQVLSESLEDTLMDLSNYSNILIIYIKEKNEAKKCD